MFLVLNGVYITPVNDRLRFVPVAAPTFAELARLIEQISQRVGRHLERLGLLVRDTENACLEWNGEPASLLDDLASHSITYRIAVGPNRGQKAFTLQTLPACAPDEDEPGDLATAGGFSLHAGIAAKATQRDKLERLCRYVTRPAVRIERDQGQPAPL